MEYKYPNCFRMYMSEGKAAWSYGVAVSTPDSESGDPGSNPGRTFFFLFFLLFLFFFFSFLFFSDAPTR